MGSNYLKLERKQRNQPKRGIFSQFAFKFLLGESKKLTRFINENGFKHQVGLNNLEKNGVSILSFMLEKDDIDINLIRELLKKGSVVTSNDVLIAINKNSYIKVKLLMDYENITGDSRRVFFYIRSALLNGFIDIADLIIFVHFSMIKNILMDATYSDSIEVIDFLFERTHNITQLQEYMIILLEKACVIEHWNIVELLLNKGVDINTNKGIRLSNGCTPLHTTIRSENLEIAKLLIKAGVDVNQTDITGLSPLFFALYQDKLSIVELLIESGCDVNKVDGFGCTPINLVVKKGKPILVDLLLKKGADVNIPDGGGWTPLLNSIYFGHAIITKILLEKSIDLNHTTNLSRYSAFHLAACKNDLPTIELLVRTYAEINNKDLCGDTPLDIAFKNKSAELSEFLIDHGAYVLNLNWKRDYSIQMIKFALTRRIFIDTNDAPLVIHDMAKRLYNIPIISGFQNFSKVVQKKIRILFLLTYKDCQLKRLPKEILLLICLSVF
jgi:ankyrin repeat protein